MFETAQKLAKNWFHLSPREILMMLVVSLLFMLGALTYVWPHVKMVKLSYNFQNQKRIHQSLTQANRLLLLERSSLQSLGRVQSIAEERLGMSQPEPDQVVTVFLK